MIRMHLVLLCVGFVMASGAPTWAKTAGWVTGAGEAQIVDGDVGAARELAIKRAQRRCVEQIVGVEIASRFTSLQGSQQAREQERFYQHVEDALDVQANGFVANTQVLNEEQTKQSITVTVRAQVFESYVLAEADAFIALLNRLPSKTVWVVIQDVWVVDGQERAEISKTLSPLLQRELIRLGFDVRPLPVAVTMGLGHHADAFAHWLSGPATHLAKVEGVTYLISGQVRIESQGTQGAATPFAALKGQTKALIESTITVVDIEDNRMIASEPVSAKTHGTDLKRAVHRAFRGRGNNVFAKTYGGLFASMKKDLQRQL